MQAAGTAVGYSALLLSADCRLLPSLREDVVQSALSVCLLKESRKKFSSDFHESLQQGRRQLTLFLLHNDPLSIGLLPRKMLGLPLTHRHAVSRYTYHHYVFVIKQQ